MEENKVYRIKIKVPESSLPLFQRLYPILTDKKGNLIIDGKALFDERYEVVPDKVWAKMSATEIFAPYIDKIADLNESPQKDC